MGILKCLHNPDTASNARKTIALSMATLLNTCMNIVLQMLLARCLDKQNVAIYMQSLLVFNTALPFLQLGITNGLYYVLVHDDEHACEIMTEGILLTVVSSLVITVFLLFGGNYVLAGVLNNEAAAPALMWLIPYMLFCVPESVAMVGLVYYNRFRFIAIYNAVKSLICVIGLILVTQLLKNGEDVFAARAIISSFFGLCTLILIYKCVIPRTKFCINKSNIVKILSVSLPLSFASMAGTLSGHLDQWIVSGMLSPDIYTVYQMGAYEIPVISIITGAISTVMIVDINKAVKDNDVKKAVEIFRNIASKTSMFLMPCMVFFFFASNDFICFLFTEKYVDSVPIFCVYLLYIPIRCVIYGPMFIALGKSKNILYRECVSLVLNGIMSIIMIKWLGMIGAAVSTILVTYVFSVTYNIYSLSKWTYTPWYKILPFNEIGKYIILSVPGGILSWVLLFEIDSTLYIGNIILKFVVFCIITLLLYNYVANISPKKLVGLIRR